MKPSAATLADWRAQVEKELAGVPFEQALVQITPEGLALQPLYVDAAAEPGVPGAAPFVRGASASAGQAGTFQICMRVDAPAHRRPEALDEDVDGGADALWLEVGDDAGFAAASSRGLTVVVEVSNGATMAAYTWLLPRCSPAQRVILAGDPISAVARGGLDAARLPAELEMLGRLAHGASARGLPLQVARISSLPFHTAGADAADELALSLSTGAAYLGALLATGLDVVAAARQLTVQIAVGRDTFGEVCKLRALRWCWHKLLAAAGAPAAPIGALHAVCSLRTQSQRDPWVNMLRVTTEIVAAALGGAELITPLAFDEPLGPPSALGRRVARNAALVLREESHLGRVVDAAGGAYYVEARTEALAREAWARFSALERDGGVVSALTSGALRARLATAWAVRASAIGRRREPVLGVSEFANLDEVLPAPLPASSASPDGPALIEHRDAEAFEALRARLEAAPPAVALIALGPPAEHRGRVGFAVAFFATVGLRARDAADHAAPSAGDIACLCGSDERYAAEAAARAAELRAAGYRRIVLAGRPGALEASLRAAGVDAFIYLGCDVVATLTALLEGDA